MSGKRRILVADDDFGIRDLVRTYLGEAGFEVSIARDGLEAQAAIVQRHPDGIILDINMPKMDGFAVLESLKPASGARMIPVLVLTARHATGDVQRAIGLGAKDYLTKPFSKAQLLARVARLVGQPRPTTLV